MGKVPREKNAYRAFEWIQSLALRKSSCQKDGGVDKRRERLERWRRSRVSGRVVLMLSLIVVLIVLVIVLLVL